MRSGGFTLLELLVAVAVFAIVSAAAYSGLHSIIQGKEVTEVHAERLERLQGAMFMLYQDLLQLAERPIRDEFGEQRPALNGVGLGDYLLEFSRDGRPNPTGARRSSLQRVAYGLRDGRLLRFLWPSLDRAANSEPYAVELLDGVSRFSVRYLQKDRQWSVQWPPANSTDLLLTPLAIEVMFEVEGVGPIRRLAVLPRGLL